MPMYEKGSVRAGPRSKQQERMKKIMKKFLSSLLALTMILSLVIVPANAANEDKSLESWAVDLSAETLTKSYSISDSYAEGATYAWSSNKTAIADIKGAKNTSSATVEAKSAGTATITCVVTKPLAENAEQGAVADTVTYTATITVSDNAGDLRKAITGITYNTRDCTISGTSLTYYKYEDDTDSWAVSLKEDSGFSNATATLNNGKLTVEATKTSDSSKVTAIYNATNGVSLSIKSSISKTTATSETVRKDGDLTLTAQVSGVSNASYEWLLASSAAPGTNDRATYTVNTDNAGTLNLTCKVYSGSGSDKVLAATKAFTVTVSDTEYILDVTPSTSVTLTEQGEEQSFTATLKQKNGTLADGAKYTFTTEDDSIITLTDVRNGTVKVTLKKGSNATVKVTADYQGKKDYKNIYIKGKILSGTLGEVTNGEKLSFDYRDLKRLAEKAIDDSVTINSIKITKAPVTDSAGGAVYESSSAKLPVPEYTLSSNDSLEFRSASGFIGTYTMSIEAKDTSNNTYKISVDITVSADDKIDKSVTGSTSNSSVSFDVNDVVDYKYLYVYGSKNSPSTSKPSSYDGLWKTANADNNWYRYSSSDSVTVPASKFSSGKATLYVIGVDSYGVASTGTITVSQKSYDINYNVVAGKSVTFNQKDFESFLEDYAEDNGNYNPKKDEITFDHAVLTSSIPSAKSEGTLYYGSTEITSSNKSKTDMTDMDKVSFDSVSKPSKGTVTLTFRVYGEIEKPNSRTPDKVNYDVNVVISVVKEDITYTVGIDDTVQLTARDFVNFLQDAKTSYRKSTLDYVKFDVSGKNVSSYAYGGLYRSYSSYSTGKLADSTDKFYYEPSRTQYDLADVAYHTTRWAEAGKTVYIPFTVYGTKNEEASGTMAITIAQTMNFIDVKASDFFYEPVKWAVNNKITNGTSSTTFSPYKNCNRAEIVTFLWRAAGTPEPTVTRNPFTDVNSVRDASYYKAILWASQKGITAGTTATTFSPYQECTRSQIVTFLYRYAGKPSGYYSNPFKDVSSVNEASYYNAILWAVGKGITQGTSTTTFSPYASCTRGEAVTFLYRYVNGVK